MHYTLRITCDSRKLWDHIEVLAHDADSLVRWYDRDVFVGNSHSLHLAKALTELEALLVRGGWLEAGEWGPIARVAVSATRRENPPPGT